MAAARGTSGSYYDDYMRSNAMLKHGGDRNAKQLLTDRNAYISFLEVQLERVSAACLSAQTFEKRLAEVEAAQLANDQKASSLAKVFRLNQEYMEQTAEQARTDLTAFASRMDAWMEKYSTELQAHETRITTGEERRHQTDTFVETLNCEVRQELEAVKATLDSDVHDLKTLVFAVETRVETMQHAQGDADQHVDLLRQIVTDRLDTDLERIRTSLSEKYIAIEEKHDELRENVQRFASEIEAGWKADLSRLTRSDDEKWRRLRDHVERIDQEAIVEMHEVKEFLHKCLDAQHLLSTTVVGLQAEVDEKKFSDATSRSPKRIESETMATVAEMDELRKNQLRLKEALRVMQSCAREAQHTTEAQYDRLVERLEVAEQQFATIAHDSLSKADDMRTKVLSALGEVEQKLRHDADAVAENAVQSVRTESKMYMSQFLETVSRLEQRVEELEHASDTIHVNVPTIRRSGTPRQKDDNRGCREDDAAQITEVITRALEKQMKTMLLAVRDEVGQHAEAENDLRRHMHALEDRINTNLLRAEERSAILPTRENHTKARQTVPNARGGRAVRSSIRPGSSSSSSVYSQGAQRSSAMTQGRSVAERKKTTASASAGKLKANRLKELCLDLVAIEGSLKSKRRGTSSRKTD